MHRKEQATPQGAKLNKCLLLPFYSRAGIRKYIRIAPRTTYLLSFPQHPFTLARHAYFETSIASLLSHNAEGFYPPERNHGRPATIEGTKEPLLMLRMPGCTEGWKEGWVGGRRDRSKQGRKDG
jgi:hypothetical protein